MSLGHSACARGKRVYVRLKDGTEFVDRFLDRTPKKRILFESGRECHVRDLDSFIVSPKIIAAKAAHLADG